MLIDATFYRNWALNEIGYNPANLQYKPSDYEQCVKFSDIRVAEALQTAVDAFYPDTIFWSETTSQLYGEGEYDNLEYGYRLVEQVNIPDRTQLIVSGLLPTADPTLTERRFPKRSYLIRAESEQLLAEIEDRFNDTSAIRLLSGVCFRQDGEFKVNQRQGPLVLINLPAYDYTLFDPQEFRRPYNGRTLRAADFEFLRGCPYTCTYCVETVIQSYYNCTESAGKCVMKGAKDYLRAKSPENIIAEMEWLHEVRGVTLFRSQDTNFLSIHRGVLTAVAEKIERCNWDIQLYIETRPDGINSTTVKLLNRLHDDGVGMGIELAAEGFREAHLNRFSPIERITNAFRVLREAGIKRTAYNIIGLLEQDEAMILSTIRFNQSIDPDNITVAFCSPFLGTKLQHRGVEIKDFDDYEYNVDAQLRTLSKSTGVSKELLEFYKANFVRLAREGLENLASIKKEAGIAA